MLTKSIIIKTSHKPGSVHSDYSKLTVIYLDLKSLLGSIDLPSKHSIRKENEQLYSLGLHDLSAREVYLALKHHC